MFQSADTARSLLQPVSLATERKTMCVFLKLCEKSPRVREIYTPAQVCALIRHVIRETAEFVLVASLRPDSRSVLLVSNLLTIFSNLTL